MRGGFASELKRECLSEFLAASMDVFLLNVPVKTSGFLYKNKIMRQTGFLNLQYTHRHPADSPEKECLIIPYSHAGRQFEEK